MAHSSALKLLEHHGRYEVLKVLGEGAAGSVLLVYDKSLTVRRAIKIINQAYMRSKTMSTRFLDEARIMARLESDNIVTVHSVGELDGWLYIVMSYMDGGSLIEHMAEFGALPPRQAVQVAIDVLCALEVAHLHVEEKTRQVKPVIHRDVKPGNVLFSRNGRVKLADFGIAQTHEHTLALTTLGSTMGTFGYMAPEQVGDPKNRTGGAGTVDLRADIHAVGVLIWMMLNWETRKVEHPGPDSFYRTWKDEGRFDKVPDGLQGVIVRATAKEPDDRYGSAREMIEALESVVGTLAEIPEDTKPLGAIREVWDARARAQEAKAAEGSKEDERPNTIVPPADLEADAQADESGGVVYGPIPPEEARSSTWSDDGEGEDGDSPIQLPFDDLSGPAEPVSDTQHEREVEQARAASMLRFHKILRAVAIVLVGVFVLAAVGTWYILQEPTDSIEVVEQDEPTPELVPDLPVETLVEEVLPPDPEEEVVEPVTPEPEVVAESVAPESEMVTPEPEQVEVVDPTPEPVTPEPEVAVETGMVKLILKVETDGVVLHLSGDGGSAALSSSNPQVTLPLGQYRVSADFDRGEATEGMNVGTLTVDSGLVTITCRSQMSLCTGKNLSR